MSPRVLLLFLLCTFFLAGLVSFSWFSDLFKNHLAQEIQLNFSANTAVDVPQNQNISPRQKIAQMLAVTVSLSNTLSDQERQRIQESIAKIEPGFVMISGKQLNFSVVQETTNSYKVLSPPVPITVAVDHEGGLVQRLSGSGFTKLDSWEHLCRIQHSERNSVFQTSAKELRLAGIDLVFGPVIDFSPIERKAMATRICTQSLFELESSSREVIEIYQQAGLVPTLKHFPGIGSLSVDLHDSAAQVSEDTEELALFYRLLQTYSHLVVMTSHASLPGETVPCSLDAVCVSLLDEYPNILIMTDAIEMNSVRNLENAATDSLVDRVRLAILAKNTVILFGQIVTLPELETLLSELEELYQQDSVFAESVDASSARVLRWKSTAL